MVIKTCLQRAVVFGYIHLTAEKPVAVQSGSAQTGRYRSLAVTTGNIIFKAYRVTNVRDFTDTDSFIFTNRME